MHPPSDVHVPVDLCNGERGRLLVTATGHIAVESGSFAAAQCSVSFDGITFASADAESTFVGMTLQNGWLPSPLATSPPAAAIVDGLVHLKGAASSGTSGAIFTLPETMRPQANVHLPTALCNAAKGRILVSTTGEVFVSAEGSFTDAQCFTGLDGLKFAPSSAGFTPLALQNGWSASNGATYSPAATVRRDVVYLQGAVRSGSGNHLATLPVSLRPQANVVVPVDLCSASKGIVAIDAASGDVSVYPATGVEFSQAQCQTSLEGVAFAVPEPSGAALSISGSALLLILGRTPGRKSSRFARAPAR